MEQEDRLSALRSGTPEAIREWAAQYAPKIQEMGLEYLGNAQEATAITKAVFSQALSAIRSGYTPADMEDWLVSLARVQGSRAALSKPSQPLPAQTPKPIFRSIVATQPVAPVESPAQASDTDVSPMPPAPEEESLEHEEPLPATDYCEDEPVSDCNEPDPVSIYDDEYGDLNDDDNGEDDDSVEDDEDSHLYYEEDDIPSLLDDESPSTSPKKRRFGYLMLLALIIIIAVLVWAMAGLLMRLKVLPLCDLGYRWFNINIYPFF